MNGAFDPRTDDIAVLAALHARAFAPGWGQAFIRDLLAGPGVFAYARAEGFILARAAGGEAEILTLAVVPEARRQGIGGSLVRQAAGQAQGLGAAALYLEVAKENEAARALYLRLGFREAGQRKAYYEGKDALILKAPLPLPDSRDFA